MDQLKLPDECELLRDAAAGSSRAFGEMVRRHQAAVRMALASLISCPSTVDDIAQDVFVAAYQNLASMRHEQALRSWLIGIARNKAKLHIRTEIRRRDREKDAFAVRLQQWKLELLEGGADDEIDGSDPLDVLQACVERLGPSSRELVADHYFVGETVESIAGRKNQKSGALRMKLLRIRRALAKCIRGQSG
jgi:RNA polymerase sigma-70 factor (ECF subfamily)